MRNSLAAAAIGAEQQSLPRPSGTTAKAGLKPELPGTSFRSLPEIAKDVVQAAPKQGALAEQIGISEGRLSSKLADGSLTVKQLDLMGDEVLVPMAERILEQRGHSALAVIRQAIRDARKALEIVEQGVEFLQS